MKWLLGILAICLISANTVFAQPTRVFMLGWDGADYDTVRTMYDAGELPNLAALGGLSTLYIAGITSTKPSWAKILTGLPGEQTGIWANNYAGVIPAGLTIFEKLKVSDGVYNIFISGKRYNVGIRAGEPYNNAARSFDAFSVEQQTLTTVYDTAKVFLNEYYLNHSTQPLLAYILTGEPDYQGHLFGSDSPEYADKIRKLDLMLGHLKGDIMRRGSMANTYIIVLSDHGFNHLNVPFPIRPIPHKFGPVAQHAGPVPFKAFKPQTHHRMAPYAIIVNNFRVFPDNINNLDIADIVLGLFAFPPPPLKTFRSY